MKRQLILLLGLGLTTLNISQAQNNTTSPSPTTKTLQGVKLLLIKGGVFNMGSPASEPFRENDEFQHSVTVGDFYLSEKEITNEQYCRFLNANEVFRNGQLNVSGFGNQKCIEAHEWGVQYIDGEWRPAPGKSNYPVIKVSWFGAKAYCDWAGGRLPTEAEWEYACRAGTTTPFNTGRNITTLQVNYDGNYPYDGNTKEKYLEHTLPVGSFPPNAWGLYDMHGNVWEWCSDMYEIYKSDPETDSPNQSSEPNRVLRGGSYDKGARYCRSAYRSRAFQAGSNFNIGFRIAASL